MDRKSVIELKKREIRQSANMARTLSHLQEFGICSLSESNFIGIKESECYRASTNYNKLRSLTRYSNWFDKTTFGKMLRAVDLPDDGEGYLLFDSNHDSGAALVDVQQATKILEAFSTPMSDEEFDFEIVKVEMDFSIAFEHYMHGVVDDMKDFGVKYASSKFYSWETRFEQNISAH